MLERRTLILLILGLSGSIRPADAAQWSIPGDFADLRAAHESPSVVAADTLVLADGLHRGAGFRDVAFSGKSLTLRSQSLDPQLATLDFEGLGAGIEYAADADHTGIVVEGITFTGTSFDTSALAVRGSQGRIVVRYCVFESNSIAVSSSQPIALVDCVVRDSGPPGGFGDAAVVLGRGGELQRVEFWNNSSGALHTFDQGATGEATIVEDCHFQGNRSSSGPAGALFFNFRGDNRVTRCDFVDNQGVELGGLALVGGGTIEDCTFVENVSGREGGGLSVLSAFPIAVERCRFTRNRAPRGGGMVVNGDDTIDVRDSVFVGNEAAGGDGGGLYVSSSGASSVRIQASLIVENTATGAGAGLWIDGGSATLTDFQLTRTTVAENTSAAGAALAVTRADLTAHQMVVARNHGGTSISLVDSPSGCPPAITCSLIWGNEGGDWVGSCLVSLSGQAGNLAIDPRFCGPGTGDYALAPTSPCLAANNSCAVDMGSEAEGSCPGLPTASTTFGGLKSRF